MRPRFTLRPDPDPSVGDAMLAKATRLKIDVMRCPEGGVWADFIIEGVICDDDVGSPDVREFKALLCRFLDTFAEGGGK